MAQAIALDEIMAGQGCLTVVDIAVPEDALVERLARRRVCGQCGNATSVAAGEARDRCEKCGGELVFRSDDTESTVRERLRVYAEATKPLVDFYSSRSTFRAVDGQQSPAAVGDALSQAVEEMRAVQSAEDCGVEGTAG